MVGIQQQIAVIFIIHCADTYRGHLFTPHEWGGNPRIRLSVVQMMYFPVTAQGANTGSITVADQHSS
mgnify:FL=1